MDSNLEDAKEHFKLSQVGFDVKSWKGESLVCHSEIDYQNRWSLTMYGAFDLQACPRNAQGKLKAYLEVLFLLLFKTYTTVGFSFRYLGECSRLCLGSENEAVRWDIPNFSDCTSFEFRDLHEKVRVPPPPPSLYERNSDPPPL